MDYRFLLFALFIGLQTSFAQSDNDSSRTQFVTSNGYIKQMQTVLYQPHINQVLTDGLFQHRLNATFLPNNNVINLHAGLRSRMFYGNFFELSPQMGETIHDQNNDYLKLSFNLIDNKKLLLNTYLDRLYAEFTMDKVEIRVGRQRINWGISTFWNPNDLFNAYDFTDFDYEERPGADAIRATWYTGPVSRLEGAIQMADNWNNVTAAMLYRWNMANFDFQVIGGKYRNDFIVGGGWSGYLGDIGWKNEFSYFFSGAQRTFNLSSGFDFSFDNGLFTSIGYLFNELGITNTGTGNLFTFQLSAKNLYPYRHAIFINANYPFSPILGGGMSVVYSPVEAQPFFISPNLTYSLAQNWDLDFFSQLFLAKDNSSVIGTDIFAFFLRLRLSM